MIGRNYYKKSYIHLDCCSDTGHVSFLAQAAKEGDFLIVGLHTDQVVNQYKGRNYPIMNLQERVLCILSCKVSTPLMIYPSTGVSTPVLEYMSQKY